MNHRTASKKRPITGDGITVLALFVLAALCFCILPSGAQQSTSIPDAHQGRKLDLREQLTVGLKATTPTDKAFIDKVVTKVDAGQLPRGVVDSTFFWARQKANTHSYSRSLRPMVYFKPGLLARTNRLGIRL
jgi:hypothetical protein